MRTKDVKKWIQALFGAALAIFWILPFYLIFINSFKTKKEIFSSKLSIPGKLRFDNYAKAMVDLRVSESFFNSIWIVTFSIVVIVIFASMAAYALQRHKSRKSTAIFLVFAIAMMIPFQSVMMPLVKQFGMMQLLNRTGLVFMYFGFGSSLAIFLYHGALKGIPVSLDEAARIDGCGRFRTFWKIIFPMLRATTVTIAVLDIIWIWNDYLLPSLVINKDGMRTIPLMTFYFFGQYTRQWHLAMAGLTIAIFPVVIFYFFAQKQIIKGIISGAVKQ